MKISKFQADFLTSKTRGTIFLGGLGSGKSHVMVLKAILLASEGKTGAIISYSLANLRDNILVLFKKILEELNINYRVVRSPNIDIYINDTKILLRTGSDPDKLRGISISWVMLEESRELNRYLFDIMLGRLRDTPNAQWFMVTTTRGKDYVYDIISSEGLLDIFNEDKRLLTNDYLTVIRTTIYESPHLPDDYIRDLEKQYTSSFRDQELLALIISGGAEIINPDWFIVKDVTSNPSSGVRFWDIAVTVKTSSDNSASCLMSKIDNKYVINNMSKVKLQYPELKQLIIDTAIQDSNNITIGIETTGQQRLIIDDLRREKALANYNIRPFNPTKDKITRSYPFASQAELGNVIVNNQHWKKDFFDECSKFNADNISKQVYHDDMIDAATSAYTLLNNNNEVIMTRSNLMSG
jgi:predicted phage terminase large subunit-like protein